MSKVTVAQQVSDAPAPAVGKQTWYGKDSEAFARNPTGSPKQMTNWQAVTQEEAAAGTEEDHRTWSPLRVKQAINALSPVAMSGVAFFQVNPANANDGSFRVRDHGGTTSYRYNFWVPPTFGSLMSLYLVGKVTSGAALSNRDIDLFSTYGKALTEPFDNHQESDTSTQYDLSGLTDRWWKLDLSSVFTLIAPNDYCGVEVDHNSLGGPIKYLGIEMRWNIAAP